MAEKKRKKTANKKTKVKESHKLLNLILILFVLIICLVLYARYVATTGLITKEYRVASKTIPSNFSGIKIIHLSDIHYKSTTFEKDIKQIVKNINVLKPDLVFFTGDLLDTNIKISSDEQEKLTNYLNSIDATLGKYRVLGEDDYNNDYYDEIMDNTDFKLIDNSYELIYNEGMTPIFLGGTSTSIKSTIDLNSVFDYYKKTDKDDAYLAKYKIVLTHEGDNAEEIMNYDSSVNLILAGHSHNGQLVIPFYGGIYLPEGSTKYSSPHYKIGKTDIYVSSGVGTSIVRYRLFNRPSFNFYRLKAL